MAKEPRAEKPKPAGKCIFCGRGDLTHEDVFPDWMQKYINKKMPFHFSRHESRGARNAPTIVQMKKRSGDPNRMRIRVVCRRCNNGWMSRLQNRARDILLPMLQGKTKVIGLDGQRVLAAWAAIAVMTAEHFFEWADPVTPQSERTWMFATKGAQGAPSQTWRIWIGRYVRHKWASRWFHTSLPFEEEVGQISSGQPPTLNAQTMTLIAGELYIHVLSSKLHDLIANWGYGERGDKLMARIWPTRNEMLVWPWDSMTDRDAINFATSFFMFWDGIARQHGY